MTKKQYSNPFSFTFGILCIIVVYIHADWAGGFDGSSLGINSYTLNQIGDLLLHFAVPSFFICWGYLSNKYIYDSKTASSFFLKKAYQFYPLYFFSLCFSILMNPDLLERDLWRTFFSFSGFYYEFGYTGGNIYIVILYSLLTISLFKALRLKNKPLWLWCLLCLVITKLMPHESQLCYFRYFGYYTAFLVGACLKEINYFEDDSYYPSKIIFYISGVIAILTPILNKLGIYLIEIQYQPNSPEQILFSLFLLKILIQTVNTFKIYSSTNGIIKIVNTIGNNAYGHFIVQFFVIHILIEIGHKLHLNNSVTQIIVILFASYLSVYLIVKPYYRLEQKIKGRLE